LLDARVFGKVQIPFNARVRMKPFKKPMYKVTVVEKLLTPALATTLRQVQLAGFVNTGGTHVIQGYIEACVDTVLQATKCLEARIFQVSTSETGISWESRLRRSQNDPNVRPPLLQAFQNLRLHG